MRNIITILKREYTTEVRKKSFIIMTLLGPLLLAALVGFVFLILKVNKSESHIAFIDDSALFHADIKSSSDLKVHVYTNSSLKSIQDTLAKSEYIDALLYIPKPKDSSLRSLEKDIVFFTNKNISKEKLVMLSRIVDAKIKEKRRKIIGVSEQDLQSLSPNTTFTIKNLKDNTQETDNELRYFVAMFLMYVIMMFIIINGVKVMRSVLEEKNNRVVEIIISSVKPFELMLGKVLGTALVALTQLVVWIVMALVLLFVIFGYLVSSEEVVQIQQMNPQGLSSSQINLLKIHEYKQTMMNLNIPLIVFVFLFYFFFGYLLYSSFFAAIGSAVDNETETQQFTFLAMVPLTLGAYGCFSILNNPDGPASFWLSIIPITSPLAMVTRSTFDVPVWHLLLSMLLLIASVLGMIYLAAKIYRTGILMYGKKTNFKELWKWITQ